MAEPEMKLDTVPPLLQQLVDNGAMTAALQEQVLKARGAPENKGLGVGQIAMKMDFIKDKQFNAALLSQAINRGKRLEDDLAAIAAAGHGLNHKTKPHWGNNEVLKAGAGAGLPAGAVAAANVGQNIVLMVNDNNPELASDETIREGVAASAQLTRFISGTGEQGLNREEATALRDKAMEALRKATKGKDGKPIPLTDLQGNTVNVEDYIRERQSEIYAGIEARLQQQEQNRGQRQDGPQGPAPQRQQRREPPQGGQQQGGGMGSR